MQRLSLNTSHNDHDDVNTCLKQIKSHISLRLCALYSGLPSNLSTMNLGVHKYSLSVPCHKGTSHGADLEENKNICCYLYVYKNLKLKYFRFDFFLKCIYICIIYKVHIQLMPSMVRAIDRFNNILVCFLFGQWYEYTKQKYLCSFQVSEHVHFELAERVGGGSHLVVAIDGQNHAYNAIVVFFSIA